MSDIFLPFDTSTRELLAQHHLKCAKVLKELPEDKIVVIETSDENTIIGEILNIKDDHLVIRVYAAKDIDFKMRSCIPKNGRSNKKTYPLALQRIVSSKGLVFEQVPLYLNFKYVSVKFKNLYLK